LLILYALALKDEYECLFLRTTLFGSVADAGEEPANQGFRVVTDQFLLQNGGIREFSRVRKQKQLHGRYKSFLAALQLDLIVIGWDNDSIGKWTSFVADEIQIPSLGCQEGSWTFSYAFPLKVRVKKLLLEFVSAIYYKPARYSKFYQNSVYVAVWGEFDKKQAIRHGALEKNVFVVGDPRQDPAKRNSDDARPFLENKTILYLDLPGLTLPKGTVNYAALQKFRARMVEIIDSKGYSLIYKVHPLTSEKEMKDVKEILSGKPRVNLVVQGIAESFYKNVCACITFPSTCIYTILATGAPLIQIRPKFGLVDQYFWDPYVDCGAGINIESPEDIESALEQIEKPAWKQAYLQKSKSAAMQIMGPDDGKAGQRFRQTVQTIFSNN